MKYDIHYDKLETHNGTGEYFDYKFDIVKKDEEQNVFMIDSTLQVKHDMTNDMKVNVNFLVNFS